MPILRRLIALAIALTAASIGGPATADCNFAGPPDEVIPTAEVAFVGNAVEVQGPIARFAVTEVWAGNVARSVEVRGISDPVAPNQFGEDDRQWVEGATYLVIPFVDGAVLRDSICTATTEWTDELAALRPADALVYATEAVGPVPVPPIVAVIAVAAVAIVGLSFLAFRHPRR